MIGTVELLAGLLGQLLARHGPGMLVAALLAELVESALGVGSAEGDLSGRASERSDRRETGKDGPMQRQLVVYLLRSLAFAPN